MNSFQLKKMRFIKTKTGLSFLVQSLSQGRLILPLVFGMKPDGVQIERILGRRKPQRQKLAVFPAARLPDLGRIEPWWCWLAQAKKSKQVP